jgi:hypothetical protein
VAESATPPLVVMTDLGDGGTVADALLGTDARAAGDAVIDWAHTIGMLHRVTQGAREVFRAALGRRSGEALLGESRMSIIADESAMRIEALCTQLGVLVASGALGELRELPRRLSGDGPGALSPHDACPDNNIRTENGLVLIDFEDAQWRHVAWDVAYLTVPWPSCWCSWRMPGDVAERALERYRTTVETELPYVRTPQFRHDVAAAAVGWSFISASWFLPNALGDDPPPENPAQPTPTRRAMILHRLGAARRNEDLPALAELAGRLRAALVERWGEVPLAYAPAFDAE